MHAPPVDLNHSITQQPIVRCAAAFCLHLTVLSAFYGRPRLSRTQRPETTMRLETNNLRDNATTCGKVLMKAAFSRLS